MGCVCTRVLIHVEGVSWHGSHTYMCTICKHNNDDNMLMQSLSFTYKHVCTYLQVSLVEISVRLFISPLNWSFNLLAKDDDLLKEKYMSLSCP